MTASSCYGQMYLTSLVYHGLSKLTVVQQEPKWSQMLVNLGRAGVHQMGKRTPPLPHQVRRVPSEVHDPVWQHLRCNHGTHPNRRPGWATPVLERTLFEGHLKVHDLVGEFWVMRDGKDRGSIRELRTSVSWVCAGTCGPRCHAGCVPRSGPLRPAAPPSSLLPAICCRLV